MFSLIPFKSVGNKKAKNCEFLAFCYLYNAKTPWAY